MAQISGRRLPSDVSTNAPAGHDYQASAVWSYDAYDNGALATMALPMPLTKRIDSTDALVTYVGMAAPSLADPAEAVWLIERITEDGAGNTTVEHAYVPADGEDPARYATAEHVWNNRTALAYA